MTRRLVVAILATGVLSGLLAAVILRPSFREALPLVGGDGTADQPTPDPFVNTVARAVGSEVLVYDDAGGSRAPRMKLANPNENGAPLVFLVRQEQAGWYHVLLPVRPNGSTGWIRSTDVTTSKHEFKMVIELSAHRATVYHRDGIFLEAPIGVGRGPTPTPIGVFFTKELLKPPNPNTAYGHFAYGLSGFSNVLTDFAGGDGVVGIHGTNDPASIGKDVSHGCIRLTNENITRLARTLPLGVPVIVQP